VPEADSGGGASGSVESGQNTGAGKGMTGGDHLSSAAAWEEAELGWRRRVGPAGGLLLGRRRWPAAARANWGGN
jgi:hypothetical protein